MYKIDHQLKIEDFVFPFGKLSPENDWVKLAEIVPWDRIEEKYAAKFVNNGAPAHPVRVALGALLVKQRLKCSDEWTVKHISENPYLQYFIGMKEYTDACPFGASTMVAFRKRFTETDLAEINEMIIPHQAASLGKDGNNDDDNPPPNSGTLIMDATCAPADIAYPQDADILNDCRERLEKTIDELCEAKGCPKPRTYRNTARKAHLKLAKNRKPSANTVRKAIRKQLSYIRRDIGTITKLLRSGGRLSDKQSRLLNTLTGVYEQQRLMYEKRTHSIPDRIVSISQPWVRPIVRGKAKAKTEFGAKIHIGMTDGYARLVRVSFDAFNEATDFIQAIEAYRKRCGCYPQRVLVDKIYRNRDNLAYCKEQGIAISGPALGRPKKDAKPDKKQEYQDICDRNAVEGKFGEGKTAYGLARIMARLEETSRTVIGVILLSMNLQRRLREILLRWFLQWVGCSVFHRVME